MLVPDDAFSFALAAFLLLAIPGPTNALLVLAVLREGFAAALRFVIPVMVAYIVAVGILHWLLGPVIARHSQFSIGLKLVAAGWLAWSAWKLWLRSDPDLSQAGTVSIPMLFMTTLLNPKALIISLDFLVPERELVLTDMVMLSLCVATSSLLWLGAGSIILRQGDGWSNIRVQRGGAVVLLGFSLTLLLSSGLTGLR